MLKKLLHREEDEPIDYFAEKGKNPTQKQEPPVPDDVVMTLRSDMLPSSRTVPEKGNIFRRINIKVLLGIVIGLILIGLIWFIAAGPVRPAIENLLVSLAREVTPTQTLAPTTIPATSTPPPPTSTPRLIPTLRPTSTPTIGLEVSPTIVQESLTPTPFSGCRDVLTITLADVGQELCVKGIVISTLENPGIFMVVFSNEPGAFYWVSYDIVWSQAQKNTCYQTNGTISQIANSPVLVFGYSNIPEVCP
jgi:hypothetical protein